MYSTIEWTISVHLSGTPPLYPQMCGPFLSSYHILQKWSSYLGDGQRFYVLVQCSDMRVLPYLLAGVLYGIVDVCSRVAIIYLEAVRSYLPRSRLVLLRGDRVRPEDTFDGGPDFYRPAKRDSACHGLHLRLCESTGFRAHAAAYGSRRFVALPPGELEIVTLCCIGTIVGRL